MHALEDMRSFRGQVYTSSSVLVTAVASSKRISYSGSPVRRRRQCRQWEVYDSGSSHTGYAVRRLANAVIYPRTGALDDGRGRARVGLFRHKHEIETGRTSSVGMEVSEND